jgi:AmmeMemoRadiSam system protein A
MSGDAKRVDDAYVPTPPSGGAELTTPELSDEAQIPALARRAVETFIRERRLLDSDLAPDLPILRQPAACFVSIKTGRSDLRGCIGTIEPSRPTLAEEIIINAVHAATRDPRFMPVEEGELPRLRYSVDVLSEPEPTEFESLNPSLYGVIVEDHAGTRRGLLLPDIEGVETSSQQVQIAARKAGINPDEPVRLFRFRVTRFREFGKHTSSD